MSLDATVLAAAIKPGIKSAHITCGAADNAALDTLAGNLASSIATAVVNHLKTAGVITVVTTCGAGAGTGTGGIT